MNDLAIEERAEVVRLPWQDAFTAYTTGMAFHVSLSHDQVNCLAAIGAGKYSEWRSRSGRSTFIPVFRNLERRGLAEHNPAAVFVGFGTPGVKLKWVYRLTPAGEHVLALLKIAGVAKAEAA